MMKVYKDLDIVIFNLIRQFQACEELWFSVASAHEIGSWRCRCHPH